MRCFFFELALFALAAAAPYDAALKAYNQADAERVIALYRQSPPAAARDHALLGKTLFLNGEFKQAAESFAHAAQAEPKDSMHQLWLGRATGRRAESASPFSAPGLAVDTRKAFEKSVQLDPKNVEALSDLFDYYLNAPGFLGGGQDKAAALIVKVRALDPAQAFHLESKLAEKRKDFPRAESLLEQAIAATPREPGRIIDLARFQAQRGRLPDAEKTFARAAAIDPNYPPLLYARAETWIESKTRLDEARAALDRYLRMPLTPDYPTRREAEKLLSKLP